MRISQNGHGRWAFALTVSAFVWALALLPAALLLPVYGSATIPSPFAPARATAVAPPAAPGGATLVAVNGARALLLMALPAVLAAVAWFGLHRTCARGGRAGRGIATAAITMLGVVILLGAFSVGGEMLPVLVLLLVARSLTPRGPARHAGQRV